MTADPGSLIRRARREAGVTQAELARRLGTTQSAVARLERPGSNPRIDTIDRALRAVGRRLDVSAPQHRPSFDPTLIAHQLRLSPAERLKGLETFAEEMRVLREAGERARRAVG